MLLLGLFSLVAVDYLQLVIPNLYQMVINGITEGQVSVDGVMLPFDMDFLLDRICLPIAGIVLCMVWTSRLKPPIRASAVRTDSDRRSK